MKCSKKLVLPSCLIVLIGLFGSLSIQAAEDCYLAPDDLVAWWPGDGDATDVEGSRDGILQGGTFFTDGKVGQAFGMDGIDDLISIPDMSFGPALTIAGWVNRASTGNYNAIFGVCVDPNSDCNGEDYKVVVLRIENNGAITGGFSPTSFSSRRVWATTTATGLIPEGQWFHVAVALDSATNAIDIYLDGVSQSLHSINVGSGVGSFTAPPSVGAVHTTFNGIHQELFEGSIDELQVFNRALGAQEIMAIYDAGVAGVCKDEDGDGFRPPEDCDESDPAVNPSATEISFNYIDENCDGNLGDCDPCMPWSSHGQYVRCVSDAVSDCSTNSFTPEEADAFVSSAVRSEIGRKGYVPPECQ